MVRNQGFSAVTKVENNGGSALFQPSNGVPVVMYYCPQCGYIEMYAAAVAGEWQQ